PSDTPVCYLCTCEKCGNILIHGTCLKCNSGTGNSFTYDTIPESFDEVQIIPNPPPQYHFNIYLCLICESNSHYGYACVNPLIDHHCCYKCGNSLTGFFCHQCTCEFCGNGAHVGYDCPAQVPSFQTLPSFPQQYPCCEDCEGLPEADHCQPSQYTVNHLIFNAHNDLLNSKNKLMEQMTSMCEMVGQFIQKKHEEEQVANAIYWKIPACFDDDDDYNFVITPNEPVKSLSMGDEHLDTIPATESDELINLVLRTLSQTHVSSRVKMSSLYDEDFPKEIYSNPLFDEEIISIRINPYHFNAELLYDNSSPRPPEEFVSENSNADIESFSPSPIPVEDSDSLMEEIDLSFTLDDPIPPSIEEDDYESERDILILEELLDNYSLSLPEKESFHFDIPSFSRPPAKPPDDNT
nr:hypothetical protein [Tanacetum cinerariifolium]